MINQIRVIYQLSNWPQNVMMLSELPWDAAVLACIEYIDWRECHIEKKPWNKIDNLALCESLPLTEHVEDDGDDNLMIPQ